MVVIRLQRRGTKKAPHHRIVVTERSRAQGGRVLETLGHYDPSFNPPHLALDEARYTFWVTAGAQVSDAVASLKKQVAKQAAVKA
jgi:small subunit ribosomal protein S16